MENRCTPKEAANFIEEIINEDLLRGKNDCRIYTRFPPEPNGYLHIGHAKAICISFGIAQKYGGQCNLRFDDTNPTKEDVEYVDSIQEDIKWLGFAWDKKLYASDYFDWLYECAEELIKRGKAFVCDLSAEEIKEYRGTLMAPGKESPYRNRSVEENLQLFREMRDGKYPDGCKVLRAKIDMASPNINMRDPVIYRILRAQHHNTGGKWIIYPMYDYAHPLSDAKEGITHSICTLEFEDHRPLYDWVLQALEIPQPPRQIEFARLNLTRTIMSKRYLKKLVDAKYVSGWDDPRMPTLSGLRRRGYTPESIKDFCDRIGVAKANSVVDAQLLEHCLREDLSKKAPRAMAVLRPLKVTIANWPQDLLEQVEAENNVEAPEMGGRFVTMGKTVYIEQDDFMENPPGKFFRLKPGGEVRLKSAYIIKCEEVIKDNEGNVIELICTYAPETKSGSEGSMRKVKGTLHWVEATTAVDAQVRLYDYLLLEGEGDFDHLLNPDSIEVLNGCKLEASLINSRAGDRFQFLRQGYFCKDSISSTMPVFNRIVGLKDSWSKIAGQ
ncbi:MAG: glutamine--tRNA ligase/YqeY domain fusion protein [Christensenellales bacterium]